MVHIRRSLVVTLVGSICWDYSVLYLSYSIVYRVRIYAATVGQFKKDMSNASLIPVVV